MLLEQYVFCQHFSIFYKFGPFQRTFVSSKVNAIFRLNEFTWSLTGLLVEIFKEIFKRKMGRRGKQLADLLQQTISTEPVAIRCLVLRGLPVILGDDTSMFFKTNLNLNEGDSRDIPVGLLCYEDNSTASPASPQLNPSRVGII